MDAGARRGEREGVSRDWGAKEGEEERGKGKRETDRDVERRRRDCLKCTHVSRRLIKHLASLLSAFSRAQICAFEGLRSIRRTHTPKGLRLFCHFLINAS